MLNWVVLITLVLTNTTHAETLEARYLAKIGKARTAKQVFQLESDYRELKEARTACQIQWHRGWVPVVCYEVLQLEIKLGLHSQASVKRRLQARLDERCEAAATEIYIKEGMQPPPQRLSSAVSGICRKQIQKASEIQHYRTANSGVWSEY